jgi:hypothetical protein
MLIMNKILQYILKCYIILNVSQLVINLGHISDIH